LPKPFFSRQRRRHDRKPPRLLLVAAFGLGRLGTGFSPRRPKHPPLPPPRRNSRTTNSLLRKSAEEAAQAQAQAQASDAPEPHWNRRRRRLDPPQCPSAYAPEAQPVRPAGPRRIEPSFRKAPPIIRRLSADYPADYPPSGRGEEERGSRLGLAEKTGLAELARKYSRRNGVPLALASPHHHAREQILSASGQSSLLLA